MISQAKLVKGEIIAGRSVWSDAARLLDFLVVDHGETAVQERGDDDDDAAAGSLEENRGRGCSGSCLVTLLSFACRAASTIHVMSGTYLELTGTCQNMCGDQGKISPPKKDCHAMQAKCQITANKSTS